MVWKKRTLAAVFAVAAGFTGTLGDTRPSLAQTPDSHIQTASAATRIVIGGGVFAVGGHRDFCRRLSPG